MANPVVCPIRPNWEEKILEGYGYRTAVLAAEDNTEQRKGLKRHPTGFLEFSFLAADAREAQAAMALLLGHGDALWAVPLWPYACPLTSAVAAGAYSFPCVTADAPFQDPLGLGHYALVWKDYLTWELVEIDAVTSGSVDGITGTALSWAANETRVLPVRIGRLSTDLDLSWETGVCLAGRIHFDFENVAGSPDAGGTVLFGGVPLPA